MCFVFKLPHLWNLNLAKQCSFQDCSALREEFTLKHKNQKSSNFSVTENPPLRAMMRRHYCRFLNGTKSPLNSLVSFAIGSK